MFTVNSLKGQTSKKDYSITCTTWDCLETNKNKDATIKGVFRKYTPEKKGKGAGHMFWDWEVLLSDGNAVPVSSTNPKIKLRSYEGKKVSIKGLVFYGIVIGSDNPDEQSATGYRIDVAEISKEKK